MQKIDDSPIERGKGNGVKLKYCHNLTNMGDRKFHQQLFEKREEIVIVIVIEIIIIIINNNKINTLFIHCNLWRVRL